MPKGLSSVSTENHSEAGLLFTSNKSKEQASKNSKPEKNVRGLLSYFWRDKQSSNREVQKRASCPIALPSSDQALKSSKTLASSCNGKSVRKSSSLETATSNKGSPNGHCVYVYPVVETILPTVSCPRPPGVQQSGRPPDKSIAAQSGHAKRKSHKRASSEDFSPRKGDKSVSFWWLASTFLHVYAWALGQLDSKKCYCTFYSTDSIYFVVVFFWLGNNIFESFDQIDRCMWL